MVNISPQLAWVHVGKLGVADADPLYDHGRSEKNDPESGIHRLAHSISFACRQRTASAVQDTSLSTKTTSKVIRARIAQWHRQRIAAGLMHGGACQEVYAGAVPTLLICRTDNGSAKELPECTT